MTREEAIKQLESLLEHCEAMRNYDEFAWGNDCKALEIAIEVLKGAADVAENATTAERCAWHEWIKERFGGVR